MRRLLLDTNIYGVIVEREEEGEFKALVTRVVVYGCTIVRKELRDTPEKISIITQQGRKNLRINLLELYDAITKEREILVNEEVEKLAAEYSHNFSKLTGKKAIDHLKNDFLLVACATLNKLDLVVSDDHKTLMSNQALRTYQFINAERGLSLPPIIKYEHVKSILKRLST
ncbi:hypothetical protein HY489_00955 [Candidatus Woesearchaeota archaeon]|nr:hypothetical protein [Candidatus Woesearchaeota archaeon]